MQQSELTYFKEILESRHDQIVSNIDGVNDELDQLNSLELNDEGDHASVHNSSMIDSVVVKQQEQELREIDAALAKIASGEYGICVMCEDEIGFQRLKVKPHAIYCIDCREYVEKENKA